MEIFLIFLILLRYAIAVTPVITYGNVSNKLNGFVKGLFKFRAWSSE